MDLLCFVFCRATSARAKKEYEMAAIGNLDEQTIVALRHRCFMVVIEALAYLTQPARRTMMGVGVPQAVSAIHAFPLRFSLVSCARPPPLTCRCVLWRHLLAGADRACVVHAEPRLVLA